MPLRPRLSALDIWRRHEDFVLGVFREALQLLRDDLPVESDEDHLNRCLYFKVLHVTSRRINAGDGSLHLTPPTYEGRNSPSPTTEGTGAESKRPDFYWGYQDGTDPDPERSVRNLVIECKRLGTPPSSSWNLNRNYVHNGIVRFVDPGHSYGKDAVSGAMIGYIQSMAIDEILGIINSESDQIELPPLGPHPASSPGLVEHRHDLRRPFYPMDFSLRHIWVDLQIELDVTQHRTNDLPGS